MVGKKAREDAFRRLRDEEEDAELIDAGFEPAGGGLWTKEGVFYGRQAALQDARSSSSGDSV